MKNERDHELIRARKSAGLKAKYAAALFGVTPQKLCDYEAGRTHPSRDRRRLLLQFYRDFQKKSRLER